MGAGGVAALVILVLLFMLLRGMRFRRYEKRMERRREMRDQYKRRSQFRGRLDVELDQGPQRRGTTKDWPG
jgi:hypothetical protein